MPCYDGVFLKLSKWVLVCLSFVVGVTVVVVSAIVVGVGGGVGVNCCVW